MIAQCLAHGSTPVDAAIAGCEEQLAAGTWGDDAPYAVLGALALLHAQAGRITEARAFSEREIEGTRQAGAVFYLANAIAMAGVVEGLAGNPHEAANHLRSAYAILELEDDRALRPEAAGELACVLARGGELAEARRLAQEARATALPNDFVPEVLWRRALALVAAQEGSPDEALRLSDDARARTAGSDWLTFHGQTLEEAAVVRHLSGDDAGGDEALREALVVYESKGNIVGAQRVRERLVQTARTSSSPPQRFE